MLVCFVFAVDYLVVVIVLIISIWVWVVLLLDLLFSCCVLYCLLVSGVICWWVTMLLGFVLTCFGMCSITICLSVLVV